MVCFPPLILDNGIKVWFIQPTKCSGICAKDEQNECKWEYQTLLLFELLLFFFGIPFAQEELTPRRVNIQAMGRPEGTFHGFYILRVMAAHYHSLFLIPQNSVFFKNELQKRTISI